MFPMVLSVASGTRRASIVRGAVLLGVLLVAVYVLVYSTGGMRLAWGQLFYVPIILAGLGYGRLVTTATAIAAGLLAGPAMPENVALGQAQSAANWLYRMALFIVIALAISTLMHMLRRQRAALEAQDRVLREKTAALSRSVEQTMRALVACIEPHLSERGDHHSLRVARLSVAIGRALGLSADVLPDLWWGGFVHDIGKVGVPERLLDEPGPLTPKEDSVVRKHPVTGRDLLRAIPATDVIRDAVEFHHERWDGSGYPDGRKGQQIPLTARIVAVADAYDHAMHGWGRGTCAHERSPGWEREAGDRDRAVADGNHAAANVDHSAAVALDVVGRGAGSAFDPAVVEALRQSVCSESVQHAPGQDDVDALSSDLTRRVAEFISQEVRSRGQAAEAAAAATTTTAVVAAAAAAADTTAMAARVAAATATARTTAARTTAPGTVAAVSTAAALAEPSATSTPPPPPTPTPTPSSPPSLPPWVAAAREAAVAADATLLGRRGRAAIRRLCAAARLAAVAVGLVLSAVVIYVTGGTAYAWGHLFYIPMIAASLWFGPVGGVVSGLAAGLLEGPWMPLDASVGLMQPTVSWVFRTIFFATVGAVVGTLYDAVQRDSKRMAAGIAQLGVVAGYLENLAETVLRTMARTIESADQYTRYHSERVSEYAVRVASRMGLDEERATILKWAGIVHDLGKVGVAEHVLAKPGPLTLDERDHIRTHVDLSRRIIEQVDVLAPALPAVWTHHERCDGSGYPRALRGSEIPLEGRILAVADVYEALTSDRPYREAWPRSEALRHLSENAGTLFDPAVVQAFLSEFGA